MVDKKSMESAISRWREVLGDGGVEYEVGMIDRYTENVTGLKREVPAVLFPASTAEVVELVAIANRFKVPLHPISRGRNWGLGSRMPVRDRTAVVDLSRMNRIRRIDERMGLAVIEPGVTQGQLYQHLVDNKLPFFFDVTGSGLETSLIGNALERGVGYFSHRVEAISNLEIVLGNGTLINTGFGHYPTARAADVYKYGVGPHLDGLFSQSNYGIVTRATFELMPLPEFRAAMVCSITDPSHLAQFIDALGDLRRRDVVRTAVHIANRARAEISVAPLLFEHLAQNGADRDQVRGRVDRILAAEGQSWSAFSGLVGSKASVRLAMKEIKRRMSRIARVRFLTDARLEAAKRVLGLFSFTAGARDMSALLAAVEPVFGLTSGVPSDIALKSVEWPLTGSRTDASNGSDPDPGDSGLLYCLPIIPMTGSAAVEMLTCAKEIFEKHGFCPYVTMNMVNSRALECVINLAFDRRQADRTEAAHRCIDELHERYLDVGFIPYRLGIQSMAGVIDETDPFWKLVAGLKQLLDPNQIISPGRYNLV